jgi:hypothetical protein
MGDTKCSICGVVMGTHPNEYISKNVCQDCCPCCWRSKSSHPEITALKALVRATIKAAIYDDGDPDNWCCGFCGSHGHDNLHRGNCYTNRPEIRAIMEEESKPE